MELSDSRYFAFYTKGTQVRVPYDRINLLEYGQKVDRQAAAGGGDFADVSAGKIAQAFSDGGVHR